MAQQDLTPQLRTRLNRVERAVGFFVTFATILLLLGFSYYIYHLAQNKGWFLRKVTYQTGVNNAAGLAVGNPVKLMGKTVGEITAIVPNDPWAYYGLTIYFRVQDPNPGYIWTDSRVRIAPADFLGNRFLEIVKGKEGVSTVYMTNQVTLGLLNRTNLSSRMNKKFTELYQKIKAENPTFNEHSVRAETTNEAFAVVKAESYSTPDFYYTPHSKENPAFWLEPIESPAVTERLEAVIDSVEAALPNILRMTNQLNNILSSANSAVSQVNSFVAEARPVVTNLNQITANLREPKGSLGDWLFPTNLNSQLTTTLATADKTLKAAEATLQTTDHTLRSTDTNITTLVSGLDRSLENLADLTSNLNSQVQVNSNILGQISKSVVDADDLVQGLKRHWLLRSAFKTNKTQKAYSPYPPRNAPPQIPRLKK